MTRPEIISAVIELHFTHGKTHDEIAGLCGKSRSSIAGLIHRHRQDGLKSPNRPWHQLRLAREAAQ